MSDDKINNYHIIVASTGSGIITTIIGHPLDTIKVHLQTLSSFNNAKKQQQGKSIKNTNNNIGNTTNSTTWQVGRSLARQNALFRGILPPLGNAIIMNTIMFTVFEKIQQLQRQFFQFSSNDDDDNNNNNKINTKDSFNSDFIQPLFSGLLSGFATACISTPTDYFKIQSQLLHQQQLKYKHNSQIQMILKNITSKKKIKILSTMMYRGHIANLAREGIFTMVYLGCYHQILLLLMTSSSSSSFTSSNGAQRSNNNNNNTNNNNEKNNKPYNNNWYSIIALASSITGGMAWIVSYPFDTIKTRIQSNPTKSYQQVFNDIGTFSNAFRGCSASTGRAILVTSLRMISYEYILHGLNNS